MTTLTSTTTLSGANEVPAVVTDATGTGTAAMDGFDLSVEGSFAGLTDDFTSGHVHAAPAGANGGGVFPSCSKSTPTSAAAPTPSRP